MSEVAYSLINPLIPAKAGTQFFPEGGMSIGIEIPIEPAPIHLPKHWIPAFAGMSGGKGRHA